jgi:hypothetical protein
MEGNFSAKAVLKSAVTNILSLTGQCGISVLSKVLKIESKKGTPQYICLKFGFSYFKNHFCEKLEQFYEKNHRRLGLSNCFKTD